MYTTMQQVIDAVKYRYQRVTQLSKQSNGRCIYAPTANGVGCGIGCLIDPDDGAKWDELPSNTIEGIFRYHPQDYDKYFHSDLRGDLQRLQRKHDEAQDVDDFLGRL